MSGNRKRPSQHLRVAQQRDASRASASLQKETRAVERKAAKVETATNALPAPEDDATLPAAGGDQ